MRARARIFLVFPPLLLLLAALPRETSLLLLALFVLLLSLLLSLSPPCLPVCSEALLFLSSAPLGFSFSFGDERKDHRFAEKNELFSPDGEGTTSSGDGEDVVEDWTSSLRAD